MKSAILTGSSGAGCLEEHMVIRKAFLTVISVTVVTRLSTPGFSLPEPLDLVRQRKCACNCASLFLFDFKAARLDHKKYLHRSPGSLPTRPLTHSFSLPRWPPVLIPPSSSSFIRLSLVPKVPLLTPPEVYQFTRFQIGVSVPAREGSFPGWPS